MKINYVPLLEICRKIQGHPRGRQRFSEYLKKMLRQDGQEVEYTPLVLMNPMAREHVTLLLDDLVELGADELAANTVSEILPAVEHLDGEFNASLIVVDDEKGGWTNRYAYEYDLRRIQSLQEMNETQAARFWITGVLWSSEVVSTEAIVDAMRTAVYRAVWVQAFQYARSLRDFLTQESGVMLLSQCQCPGGDSSLSTHSHDILEALYSETEKRSFIECAFGDPAAESLGYTQLGLEEFAGLRLAYNETLGVGSRNDLANHFPWMSAEMIGFCEQIMKGGA